MNPLALPFTAAALLVALSVLVLLKEYRQGRVSLAFGLLLLALMTVFDALALQGAGGFWAYKRLALFCKSLLPATFLIYGTRFIRRTGGSHRALATVPLLGLAAIFSLASLLIPIGNYFSGFDVPTGRFLLLGPIGYWFYLALMIFSVAALVNLESVFTGIRGTDRWSLKYEFLGVGSVLAVLIFYFSQGLFYKAVNLDLLPVRSGVVIVAALLIGYSRLYRGRTSSIAVSRQALYRSFTLVAVGLYLLVLGLIGEGMRWLNISLTRGIAIFVAILSGLAFLVLLLSEEIRRRVRVFLTKHFYAQKHDYREEWLGFSNALASCRTPRDVQAAIVERYHAIYNPRFTALYTRNGGTGSFVLGTAKDRAGAPAAVKLTSSLLGYFAETGRVLNPVDGEYALEPVEEAFVREIGAWLVVPLMAGTSLEAFVVLGRQKATENLIYEDFDLMKLLGRQAVLSMKNFQLTEELAEARELAAVAKVSSFVIHDLKNLAYTFSLMMENAELHIAEPDFQKDLVKSIRSTVGKMNNLIVKLKTLPGRQELQPEAADLAETARETVDELRAVKPAVGIVAACDPARASFDRREMRKVALNLLLNAGDASREGAQVTVRTGRRNGEVFLSVEDHGCGMSPSFIEHQLFRPFRTTKEKGLGIGLYQCKQIVEAHGGRIEVASREGEGTLFTVVLPAAVPA